MAGTLNNSAVVNGQLVPQQGASAWAPVAWAQTQSVGPAPLPSVTPAQAAAVSQPLQSTAASMAQPFSISNGVALWAVVLLVGSVLALNAIHWREGGK